MNGTGSEQPGNDPETSVAWGDESSIGATANTTPLVERIAITAASDVDTYSGHPPASFDQRLFGGHILAQAILSAARTLSPQRVVNSLHAYFLRSGGPHGAVSYQVNRVRDGRSFSNRSVSVEQGGKVLALVHLSFNELRDDVPVTSAPMPDVPDPENLPDLNQRRLAGYPADGFNWPPRYEWWTASRPLDVRYVDIAADEPARCFWFRAAPAAESDENIRRAIVAYASDRSMLPVISKVRGELTGRGHRRVASVDHALWFHSGTGSGEWMLHVQDSPASTPGLGVARGLIHARDGSVIASVAQQGVFLQR